VRHTAVGVNYVRDKPGHDEKASSQQPLLTTPQHARGAGLNSRTTSSTRRIRRRARRWQPFDSVRLHQMVVISAEKQCLCFDLDQTLSF